MCTSEFVSCARVPILVRHPSVFLIRLFDLFAFGLRRHGSKFKSSKKPVRHHKTINHQLKRYTTILISFNFIYPPKQPHKDHLEEPDGVAVPAIQEVTSKLFSPEGAADHFWCVEAISTEEPTGHRSAKKELIKNQLLSTFFSPKIDDMT